MKYPLIASIAILLNACTEEVNIEMPPIESQLAITLLLQANSLESELTINSTQAFLDTSSYKPFTDAQASLFSENGLQFDFVYIDSIKKYHITNPPDSIIAANENYTLDITFQDNVVEVTDYIPSSVQIDTVIHVLEAYVDEDGYTNSSITVDFNDPVNVKNFYEIELTALNGESYNRIQSNDPSIISESYYPSILSLDKPPPFYLPFNDKLFDGESKQITIYYGAAVVHPGFVLVKSEYLVHLRTTSEAYYKYRTTQLIHNYNKLGDMLYGMAEPINVYSNISDGTGIFAGYVSDTALVIADPNKTNKEINE